MELVRKRRKLLGDRHPLLKSQGLLLISVPNVANITVMLSLLFGGFEYVGRGILDKTHLRFFTRQNARRLIEQTGYTIVSEAATVIPMEVLVGLPADNVVMCALNFSLARCRKLIPSLFGYQGLFFGRSRFGSSEWPVNGMVEYLDKDSRIIIAFSRGMAANGRSRRLRGESRGIGRAIWEDRY